MKPIGSLCVSADCMMWRLEYNEEKREDSGGKEPLFTRGVETNRDLKQLSYDVYGALYVIAVNSCKHKGGKS